VKSKAKKRGISRCPKLLDTKIYKTGQTRGADDDVIRKMPKTLEGVADSGSHTCALDEG